MSRQILILLFPILLAGCSLQPEVEDVFAHSNPNRFKDPLIGLPDLGPIRFDRPFAGQRSYYIGFKVNRTDYVTNELVWEYDYSDTLVVAITRGGHNGPWEITEFFTEYSQGFREPEVVRSLEVTSDSIYLMKPEIHKFSYLLGSENLVWPVAQITDSLNSDGLPYLGHSYKIWYQYTVNLNQFDQVYDSLNVYYDYTEMTGDGLGVTFVYSTKYGVVRMEWASAWNMS